VAFLVGHVRKDDGQAALAECLDQAGDMRHRAPTVLSATGGVLAPDGLQNRQALMADRTVLHVDDQQRGPDMTVERGAEARHPIDFALFIVDEVIPQTLFTLAHSLLLAAHT